MRYFITFSYDGARYHGWQIQPNAITVQGELERALSLVLRQEVQTVGAGRTDTGVHARMMVAHFDLPQTLEPRALTEDDFERQMAYRLNKILPRDIAVVRVDRVCDDAHARYSALSRTYYYYVHTRKDPFLHHCSCEMHYGMDFTLMQEAADALLEYKDFAAFCKSHADVKTTLCDLTVARWVQMSETEWRFEIKANRFLRNMVRAVVGTLIEVGRGRMSLADFRSVVEGGRRTQAGESMPAHALYLEHIEYPGELFCNR